MVQGVSTIMGRLVADCALLFGTDVVAMVHSHYGKPRKPVHLSNVQCTGSEENILSCIHTQFTSLDEKKEALSKSEVAGVICQSRSTSDSSDNAPTGAPVDQNSNCSVDQTRDGSHSSVIPLYLIAFVLVLGLLITTVLATV